MKGGAFDVLFPQTRRPTLLVHLLISPVVIVACRYMVLRSRGVGRGGGRPGGVTWGFATNHVKSVLLNEG